MLGFDDGVDQLNVGDRVCRRHRPQGHPDLPVALETESSRPYQHANAPDNGWTKVAAEAVDQFIRSTPDPAGRCDRSITAN